MDAEEPNPSLRAGNSLAWALCFEVGLGVLALLLGYGATQTWPVERLHWPPTRIELGAGLLSALPMLALMVALRCIPWGPLVALREFVDEKLVPMFRGLRTIDLLMLSLAAGWGEELLFRGLMQAEVSHRYGIWIGIISTSFVFALVHFMTPAYFVIAFVVGGYLGWLFWFFDSLWVPILAHSVYDFLMLLFILRKHPPAPDAMK